MFLKKDISFKISFRHNSSLVTNTKRGKTKNKYRTYFSIHEVETSGFLKIFTLDS